MTGLEAALASGLLKVTGSKLFPLIASEFASIMGVTKDLSELQDILAEITSWLFTVRDRIESEPSCRWVLKLKNVAYDIDDLLNEVLIEEEKHKMGINGDNCSRADYFCAKPKSFLFRCKMAHKIKAIKHRFSEIVRQRSDVSTILNNLPSYQHFPRKKRANGEMSLLCNVEQSRIPIRNLEKDGIIKKLIESNEGENVWIVSIVGLGGSGKTTLAKQICHDVKIKQHFKSTIFWVHVSEEFDVKELIGKLFETILEQKSDLHAQQHMVDAISSKLRGKKFLLVLDDAWHDDRLDWEQFMVHVNFGAPGSKILLTTRDEKVAEAAKSRNIFSLAFLSEVESWNLFLESSGLVEDDLEYEFMQVGKEIVNKCGGVPLAIRTLGCVLYDKRKINTWRAIRASNLWNVDSIKDRVFASLKLSYIHLPDHLKQCFTFCSIFPKGYEITKDHLIAQWIAHGFINAMNEELPEDIGSAYFDSLTKLCFLQDAPRKIFTCQLVYKMHDLIHDLTRQILQHEMVTSLQKNITPNCILRCRYLSLTSTTEKVSSNLFDKAHALYVSGGNISFEKPMKKCCNIRSVVLDYTSDTPFPLFILKFQFLGYLKICNVNCTEFPEAISSCWNLQALHIMQCKGFSMLPESIGKLKKLRTLELLMVTDIRSLPQSIGDCQDLRSLQIYYCNTLIEIPSSIGKIEKLNVLGIVNCVCLNNQLQNFTWEPRNLDTVNLSGCHNLRDLPSAFSCRTLRTMDLSRTDITLLPQWVTLISTLECIKLEYCTKLVELPKDITNLRRLEVLYLNGCSKLRCMPSGFGQLTRLRWLGLFVVGCDGDAARISELENLDMISGWLRICNLKYLKDLGDAKKACLKKKHNIHSLTLNWSRYETEEELVSDIEEDLSVLDSLEPPSGIEFLQVIGYLGPHLPCWMRKQSDSSCSGSIMTNQTSSPKFLWLTELSLELLLNLKSLQGLVELPSLWALSLIGMPNLEELWITDGLEIGDEQVGVKYCFPVLTNLHIERCPKLFVKPWLPPGLEILTFEESNEQLLSPGSLFSCQPTPPVSSSCSALVTVPMLKELRLHRVTGSAPVWEVLQHLTSLQLLHITRCSTLCKLPEGIQHLTSLQQLALAECSALESLPQSIKRLTALKKLFVSGCRGLTERCEEGVGDDWHLISHIPDVMVDDIELLLQRHRACASATS
ncbi:hypothetical protein BDA96_05G077300 [Sorghum bicolor]|uniref:Uncharacterized protein n=1 Tax=Sorghum bicolor TaxID=4558 RepID=A0A921UFM8_SORBI|nr:hypothetical protein BDA96_05G077300 [Sorghum bicolor]KAG0529196.1 hypothetical protein BDA96_05G077300 [Sorghum bicolor]